MKLISWVTFFILIFSMPNVFGARELLDQVIAVVNDEPINQSELDMMLKPIYDQYREEFRGEELVVKLNDARRKILNQLIEDRLVYQAAKEKNIEPNYNEIDEKIKEFQAQFPSDLALDTAMHQQGLSMKDVRDRLTRQAMIGRLHDSEIRSRIVISPKEVESYYAENESKFSAEERLKVRSITIKKSYEARDKGMKDEAAWEKITKIRADITSGADFSKLAKENSEDVQAENGGLSDWIQKGAMIPVINDAIFSMKVGDVSEILETSMGYHLFRVEERELASKKTLDQVRDEIFAELYRKKSEERFYEWMQELKRKAYISIR